MRRAWYKLGLRGRLGLSIGALVLIAFAVVLVAVRSEMSHESGVISHEESREQSQPGSPSPEPDEGSSISPIKDAQSDVEKTFLLVGGATLIAALVAGYLLAARTASPLRRFAATAAEVDAGDLSPRLDFNPAMAAELRTLAEAFNHMLDRLDAAFARQRLFVSDASHELRSPVTAIRGQLEVLARNQSPTAEEILRVKDLALTETTRVERIVDDLLTLARFDEGAVGPSLRSVGIGPFLQGFSGAAPGRAEIKELPDGTIRLDPDLIAQVIRNLLSNARRHAGAEGRVVISAREINPGTVVISIDDDGPGIPIEEREQVFDRFHRSERSRDRATGGSGLGLGIARSIVEMHGGRIWFEDSPLGGAKASFSLPGFQKA